MPRSDCSNALQIFLLSYEIDFFYSTADRTDTFVKAHVQPLLQGFSDVLFFSDQRPAAVTYEILLYYTVEMS